MKTPALVRSFSRRPSVRVFFIGFSFFLQPPLQAEEEVIFSDDFESYTADASVTDPPWDPDLWYSQGNLVCKTTYNHTPGGYKSGWSQGKWWGGDAAFASPITDGKVSIWFYDDGVGISSGNKEQYAGVFPDDGFSNWFSLGVRTGTSATKYSVYSTAGWSATSFDRSIGWHNVVYLVDNTKTEMYLDGAYVTEVSSAVMTNLNMIDMGSDGNGGGDMWFDDVKAYRGQFQSAYRWYSNTAGTQPESPTALAAENTAITGVVNGDKLRLRLQVRNAMSYAWSGAYTALRYREGTNGAWTALGPTAHWDFADGAGGNGSVVANSFLTGTEVKQHFVEASPSAAMVSVPAGQDGEWDICVSPVWANVLKGVTYYFKLVLVDGSGNYLTDIVSYPKIPAATTQPSKTWVGGDGTGVNKYKWSRPGNWSGGVLPAVTDEVLIPVVTYMPVLDLNDTVSTLTLVSGATLELTNVNTLQVNSNAAFYGTVTQTTGTIKILGSSVTVSGAYTQSSSGNFWAYNATMTINQGATFTQSGTGYDSLGNLTISGTYTQSSTDNILALTNLTINGGGAFTNTRVTTTSYVYIGGNLTNNGSMVATTGGNFTFKGATSAIAGTSSSTTMYRYTLQTGAATVTSTGSPPLTVLGGGIILTAGSWDISNKTILCGGDWTNNGATVTTTGSTVEFSGDLKYLDNGSSQTIFNNVTMAGLDWHRRIASRSLDINGNAIVSCAFDPSTYTHYFAGNWNDTVGRNFSPSAGTIVFDGVSPTITTRPDNNFYHLTISTSGTASMGPSELDVNGNLTISAGATLNCGSSALNDVAGTTGISGTLNSGGGTTTLRGAVTVNSGGTLLVTTGSAAPTVKLGNGAAAGSITVNSGGAFNASGSPVPTLTRQGTANYTFSIASGATISVDGLNMNYVGTGGLAIANGATISKIDNLSFATPTSTCLSVGAASGSYTFNYCAFDASANPNVTAPNGATVLMNNASGARGADPNGEANDGAVDGNITWAYGKVWSGAGNTLWSNTANWSGAAIPVSTDNVVIPSSGITNWPQLNMNATGGNSMASLTLLSGATLNLNNGSSYTLQVDGNATFGGTVTHTTANVSIGGTAVTIGGAYTQSGAGTFSATSATMTVNTGATYTQSGAGANSLGNLSVSGTYIQSTADNTLSLTNLTINTGGEFRNTRVTTTSYIDIAGALTNNGSMTNTTGGNFRFSGGSGSVAGSSASTKFYLFTLTSGTTTISSSVSPAFTALGGGVLLSGGTLSSTGKTIAVQGNWTNNGGAYSGSSDTVKFTGGSGANADNGTAQTTFRTLVVGKSVGVTLTAGRALDINGDFAITSGIFAPSTYSHTVAGSWNDAGGGFTPSAGTVTFDGSSPSLITAGLNNFYNLTFSNSGTATMGSYELDVNGVLTVSAGSIVNCGSNTGNDVAGTTGISGIIDLATGTTTLRGAVTVNSGGILRMETATTAATLKLGGTASAGDLTVASGGTLSASGTPRPTITRTGSVNYSLAVASGGAVDISGLNIEYTDADGFEVANGATITRFNDAHFSNGTKYMNIGAASGSYTFTLCEFDATANPNVTAPNGAIITMANATGARGADPNGEANDGTVDGNITWSYAKVWTGGASTTNWTTAGNWSPANEPTSADDILIPDATYDPLLVAASSARSVIISNGALSLGSYTLDVYGDLTIQAAGTISAGTGTISMRGGIAQSADAPNKTFYNLTATSNSTVTLNSTSTVTNTLTVNAGSSLTLASGKTLTLSAGLATLGGTLDLQDNSILKTGGNITTASGSMFKLSGTSQDAGGFVTLQNNGSGNYSMTLGGSVEANCGRIYHLANAGLTISGDGGSNRNFANIRFYTGQSTSITYMHLTHSAWNGKAFSGLGFENLGSGTKTIEINSAGGDIIYMTNYLTSAGWIYGDATETQTAGTINWIASSPTAKWSRASMGQVNGLSVGGTSLYAGIGTGAGTSYLKSLNASDGADKWSYPFDNGTFGTATFIYSAAAGSKYRVLAAAGNYVVGLQDNGASYTELFTPINLGSAAGNPYASPDDASFYVTYTD